ncbi:riboflavin biosynthesis protein RibF [Sporosarcina sp. USHLN248]|uniref:riboflavin biosynthesis protein RibF n=1 Tax=Sporosarcina sp. USHLN248 TaxID=3081300 RepID=UPI00301B1360
MEIYRLQYPDHMTVDSAGPFSMAIGFFDGLHKGHQTVIRAAKDKAEELNMKSAVMTFDPHPSHLFGGGKNKVGYITQFPEKVRVLQSIGIDTLFVVKFDWELASLTPEKFVELFIKGLNVKHVSAGFDFTFGSKGSGTMETMKKLSDGFYDTTTVEKVTDADDKISSTRIRQLLAEGNVEETKRLLGRPFRTSGIVVHGEKRGRLLGFPTANIQVDDETILPVNGVYAVRMIVDGKKYDGVCNVGVKPTFHDPKKAKKSVEVHLIGFEGDLYDKEAAVEWIASIRQEQKFNSVDDLINQIGKDKQTAINLLRVE